MARTEVPTGDSIAAQIKGRTADSNFADIARMLTSDHDHRPGLFQQDLAKVNDALHAQGLLPGVDLVGVNGQDFVTKSQGADQTVSNVDATNLSRTKEAANGKVFSMNGRIAAVNSDGSGNVVATKGDSPWSLSSDILKSQGITNPDQRQIANMYKELQQLNPAKTLDHLKPGDKINYPAGAKADTNTAFTAERANDAADQSKKDAQDNYDGAMAAMGKFGENAWGGLPGAGGLNITMDEVNTGLAKTDITDADRKALTFIKDNFNQIAVDGRFWQNDLGTWKDKMINLAEIQRVSDLKD